MAKPDLFQRFSKIIQPEELLKRNVIRLRSKGFLDFVLEVLTRKEDTLTVSLAHRYLQNGDLIPDPEMVVEITIKDRSIRPLSIQMSLGSVVETTVNRDGKEFVFDERMKDLTSFLGYWLNNLADQGFRHIPGASGDDEPELDPEDNTYENPAQ